MHTLNPPEKTKLDPMVIVEYAAIFGCFNHAQNADCNMIEGSMEGWSKVASNMSYWDYPYTIQQTPGPVPYMAYRNLGKQFRFMADCNVVGYFPCGDYWCDWSFGALRHYLIVELMWDPYMSEEEFEGHVKKFMEGYFGEGWEYIYESYHLYVDNYTRCNGILTSSPYFSDVQVFFQYQKIRNQIDTILSNFETAKLMSSTAAQWTMTDCNQIQFEYTNLTGIFDKLYKSSDSADNALAQEMSHALQDKMQKYSVILSESKGVIYDFESFTVRPDQWVKVITQ
jgi:hypothetical protein